MFDHVEQWFNNWSIDILFLSWSVNLDCSTYPEMDKEQLAWQPGADIRVVVYIKLVTIWLFNIAMENHHF